MPRLPHQSQPPLRRSARAQLTLAATSLTLLTGCGSTDWGVRDPLTLSDIGDGILGIGAALGGAVGLNALHDAGGANSSFGTFTGDDNTRNNW